MTGSSTHQQIESQLRKSIGYSNEFQVHDASKNLANSRIAYRAMGISPKLYYDKETRLIKQVGPEVLDAHRNSLKTQYDALETSTTPVFDRANVDSLDSYAKAIKESPFTEAAKYSKIAQKAVDMAKSTLVQNRSSLTGRLETGKNFDGTTYKSIRSMLKDGINGAYKAGDTSAAKQLQPLLAELDAAAEKGVARAKGTTGAKQWKDLNTKYAMTNLVLEHGMGTNGIDPTRLYDHLRSNDAMRLFLDKGPPQLQSLQKLAKVGDILAHQDKAFGAMKQPKSLGVFTSVAQMASVPGLSQLTKLGAAPLLWAYKKGYPGTTGFLNMHPDATLPVGPFRAKLGRYWEGPGLYTHAAAQSSQAHDKILRGGIKAAKYIGGGINDTSDIISKGLADLLQHEPQPEVAPDYGKRPDGTSKGNGYFGPLKMQDGSNNVATEMSIGVNFDGKEVQIPSIVPTLNEEQKQYLLKGGSPNDRPDIIQAAVDHAKDRLSKGASPYADMPAPRRY